MEIVLRNPLMILFFLIIPLLIMLHFYFFEHNKRRSMKFSNFSAMRRVTGTTLITKNTGQLILRVIVFICLIIGLSKPLIWYEGITSTTDYAIVIDASASMVSEDVLPDRLTVAKRSASAFLDSLDAETKISVVSFAGTSFIKSPLTADIGKAKQAISNIDIELSGGTDIGAALITASNMLNNEEKAGRIILITDGSDTAGSFVEESTETALEYIKIRHIIVDTIGVGTGLSGPGYLEGTDLRAAYDTNTLSKIAEETGGNFYEIKSSAEIAAAFKDIKVESVNAKISYDPTTLFLILSLILLFVEWSLLNTRFRALP